MKIGVIGFQGAIKEHLNMTRKAKSNLGLKASVIPVRKDSTLSEVNGIIIPGGESTTIGKLLAGSGIFEKIIEMGNNGIPILGTCAGMILLSKEVSVENERREQPLLELMDTKVIRNAFGRQKESFEAKMKMKPTGKRPFKGVFIRAPAVKEAGEKVDVLAKYENKIVAAEQNNFMALSFHPELTNDTRIHEYYLKKVKKAKQADL